MYTKYGYYPEAKQINDETTLRWIRGGKMEKISPQKVGERIRAVRGKRTQTEFAKALGVKKQNYISRYERGRIPSPDLLVRIAEMGRVSIDWLLTGKKGGGKVAAVAPQQGRGARSVRQIKRK